MQAAHFWNTVSTPILGLSPMDGLTDYPFRTITKKYGNPAVMYTEFTSVEGICHGAERLLREFMYSDTERPVIGQIYGTTPEYFRQTAILLCELGFDGIDINMGCPAKNVAHSGAGAALIRNPQRAQAIIAATKQGATDWMNGATLADCPDMTSDIRTAVAKRTVQKDIRTLVPVSVKTRVGYNEPVVESWIPTLIETGVAAIALHGRTLSQQYGGLANWELIGQAAQMVKGTGVKILGNGDIDSYSTALQRCSTYCLDGVLIGRGALGNPFIFQEAAPPHSIFAIALEHAKLYEQAFSHQEKYTFLPMRKHLSWYVRAIPNATQIRTRLVLSQNAQEVEQILRDFALIE